MSRASLIYFIASSSLLVTGVTSFLFSMLMVVNNFSLTLEYNFLQLNSVDFNFVLFFDFYSLLFASFVSFISASVVLYSVEYMSHERRMILFLIKVLLFVGSMFFVIFSLNMVSIMLGWDGLGLTSYLLVLYYKNSKSSAAAMITALSNRVGDAAILITIGLMVDLGGWSFMGLMSEIQFWPLILFVILASITKSAQIPFSAWLPAAMAAPTPVSALVHSSTLVTAGVYLLIRFSPALSASGLNSLVFYLGFTTMVMASLAAMVEIDIKKVIALSTLSQLGLMMLSLGINMPSLAMFHLLTHATFKALLFMCAGEVIHTLSGNQDLRILGYAANVSPATIVSLNACNLALCGFPFLAGFYSKDMILEMGLSSGVGSYFYFMMLLGISLSSIYSARMIYFSSMNYSESAPLIHSSEGFTFMYFSKYLLILLAAVSGAMFSWMNNLLISTPMLSVMEKLCTLGLVVISLAGGYYLSWSLVFTNFYSSLTSALEYISEMIYLNVSGTLLMNTASRSYSSLTLNADLTWLEINFGQGAFKGLTGASSYLGYNIFSSFKNMVTLLAFGAIWLYLVSYS